MSKRPMYLQHVNIYVRNAERSKQWCEDLLGLHTYEYRPGWAAFMSADKEQSHEVALMQLGPTRRCSRRAKSGSTIWLGGSKASTTSRNSITASKRNRFRSTTSPITGSRSASIRGTQAAKGS